MLNSIAGEILGPARLQYGDLSNVEADFSILDGDGAVVLFTSSVDNASGDSILRTDSATKFGDSIGPFSQPMTTLRLILQPLVISLALAFASARPSRHLLHPSASMEPTLRVGDAIVSRLYASEERPRRGDIVVFRSPSSGSELVVKRVIATPRSDREPQWARDRRRTCARGAVCVRADGCHRTTGHPRRDYFVLGDNRGMSYDSRQWGAIPQGLVVGRARFVMSIAPLPRPASRDAFQIRTVTFIRAQRGISVNASARSRRQRQITTRLIAVAARARRDLALTQHPLRDPLIPR